MSAISDVARGFGRSAWKFKAPIAKGVAAATVAGGLTYGASKAKDEYAARKINREASGYDRHIAGNLREGTLTVNNLSDQDYGIAENMYKISSQDKRAMAMTLMEKRSFLTTAMNIATVANIGDTAKKKAADNTLKQPSVKSAPQIDEQPELFGIDKQRLGR